MWLSRWLRSRSCGNAAILLYHRVTELDVDPWGLAVTPSHFREHLEVLERKATVLALQQLISRLQNGTAPPRAVALTVDDGYADNLTAAKPLLEMYGAPATVFVTTGPVIEQREFWWDELEALLLTEGQCPPTVEITVAGERWGWTSDESRGDTGTADRQHTGWRAGMHPPTQGHAAYIDTWRRLQLLNEPARRSVLNSLWTSTGRSRQVRASHRPLLTHELCDLASGGLVEIGAHTVTHSRLSVLRDGEQRDELAGSRRFLERLLEVPVTALSYPFGGPADYTPQSVSLAREAGFHLACAARPGRLDADLDRFRLPRCFVPDVGGDRFEELLVTGFKNG